MWQASTARPSRTVPADFAVAAAAGMPRRRRPIAALSRRVKIRIGTTRAAFPRVVAIPWCAVASHQRTIRSSGMRARYIVTVRPAGTFPAYGLAGGSVFIVVAPHVRLIVYRGRQLLSGELFAALVRIVGRWSPTLSFLLPTLHPPFWAPCAGHAPSAALDANNNFSMSAMVAGSGEGKERYRRVSRVAAPAGGRGGGGPGGMAQ